MKFFTSYRDSFVNLCPLKQLTKLESLYLSDNNISDISVLRNMVYLKELHLENNSLKDISPLENLTNLQELYLYHNEIKDISALANLTNLKSLEINGNNVTDISVLKNLQNLTYLNITDNPIEDISVLTELANLESVYLYDIKLDDKALNVIHDLIDNGVDVSFHYPDDYDPTYKLIEEAFPENAGFTIEDEEGLAITLPVNEEKTVKLTSEQVNVLSENSIPLKLEKPDVTLVIPSEIFAEVNGEFSIIMEKLEDVEGSVSSTYDFTITVGEDILSEFPKGITLTFDVDLSKVTNPDHLKVFYLNENTNEWIEIGGTYHDGKVTAETNHFSKFTVFEVEPEEKVKTQEPKVPVDPKEDKDIATQGEKDKNGDSDTTGKDNTTGALGKNDTELATDEKGKDKTTQTDKENETDNKLPKTATNMFNLMLFGFILVIAGLFVYRRKVAKI